MAKSKPTPQADARQLARMLMADTSLTEGEKVELIGALAGLQPRRKPKAAAMPDWLAGRFAAHDAAGAARTARQRRRRYTALLVLAAVGMAVTTALVWVAGQWGGVIP